MSENPDFDINNFDHEFTNTQQNEFPEEERFQPATEPQQQQQQQQERKIFGEFEVGLILFLVVGFALRDLLQSLMSDIVIPTTSNVLGIQSPKNKKWIPYRGAAPIRYGEFLEAVYGFVIIVGGVYIVTRILVTRQRVKSRL